LPLATSRTGQTVGVEERDEFAVAGALIQIVDQREGDSSPNTTEESVDLT